MKTDPETLVARLLPCPIPWCGGEAQLNKAYPDMRERYVICEKCRLRSPNSKPFDVEGIIALWNTRPADLIEQLSRPSPVAAQGERLRAALAPFADISKRKAMLYIRPNDPIVMEAVRALGR